jgi:hypothetical protein
VIGGEWHLTHEEYNYDDDEHNCDLTVVLDHCAQQLFP